MRKSKPTPPRVLFAVDDYGNATLTLNRPEVHNAFDPEMVDALSTALQQIAHDSAIRAVVIAGAGPSFCAGADIAHMRASAHHSKAQNQQAAQASAEMFHQLFSLNKPTIAAVHGAVRGGGCGLVAACDIAVTTRTATFRFSEVNIGIIPAMISPYILAAIGERHARRWMLTGEEFDAAEAWRMGLVHDLVEADDLAGRVGLLLGELYTSGPHAMHAVKQLITQHAHRPIDAVSVKTTASLIAEIRATAEGQEGLGAFLEKRKPVWTLAPQKAAESKTKTKSKTKSKTKANTKSATPHAPKKSKVTRRGR